MGPKNSKDNTGKQFEDLIDELYWDDPEDEDEEDHDEEDGD